MWSYANYVDSCFITCTVTFPLCFQTLLSSRVKLIPLHKIVICLFFIYKYDVNMHGWIIKYNMQFVGKNSLGHYLNSLNFLPKKLLSLALTTVSYLYFSSEVVICDMRFLILKWALYYVTWATKQKALLVITWECWHLLQVRSLTNPDAEDAGKCPHSEWTKRCSPQSAGLSAHVFDPLGFKAFWQHGTFVRLL